MQRQLSITHLTDVRASAQKGEPSVSKEQRYSSPIVCRVCGNTASMKVLGQVNDLVTHESDDPPDSFETGEIYELLKCPKCDGVTITVGGWHDFMEPEDFKSEVIFPPPKPTIPGLPPKVQSEYEAAQAVSGLSPNAYAVLIGRTLDVVCTDRRASGKSLNDRIRDLANRNEIPAKLAAIAHGLRQLRNVGAHADLGSLTPEEIPVLEALCSAILEYVYRAPQLVALVEKRLKKVKSRPKRSSGARAKKVATPKSGGAGTA